MTMDREIIVFIGVVLACVCALAVAVN